MKPHFLSYYNRGNTYFVIGDLEKAFEDFNQSIELNPNHFLSYYNKGAILEKLEKQPEAIEEYKKALQLNPEFHLAAERLAFFEQQIQK